MANIATLKCKVSFWFGLREINPFVTPKVVEVTVPINATDDDIIRAGLQTFDAYPRTYTAKVDRPQTDSKELKDKFDEMSEKARERGYTCGMRAGDYSQGTFSHDVLNGTLIIHPRSEKFEFKYITSDALTLSTGMLGSFYSDEHFKRWEAKMHAAAFALHMTYDNQR